MSKYDSLKFLKKTKARKLHLCRNCECEIKSGDTYFKESIGRVNAPGVKLETYCYNCGERKLEGFTSTESSQG